MDRDEKGIFIKGHECPPEIRAKIRATKKANPHGHPCWMKGLTKETDARIARMAATKRGKQFASRPYRKGIRVSIATEFKKGIIPNGGIETRFKAGPNHPLWKGGISPESAMIRKTKEYREWRKKVYQRDHFICQDCEVHCEPLNIIAHHLKEFENFLN